MTDQIPDSCTFDGRRWEIVSCDGNHCECIPTNDELGIKTVASHTANWAGRINHFLVLGHQLYLAKIEVTLDTEQDTEPLERFRREVVTRYEPMQCFDAEGEREVINEYRSDYIFFDDVAIPFTGTLHLSGPYIEDWDIPEIALEHEPEAEVISLHFSDGELIEPDVLEFDSLRPNASTFDSLWDYCTSNHRLVPLPPQWTELFKMLHNTQQKASGGWEPPLPLILAAWHHSMPIEKELRFKEHLKWAEEQGQLDEIEMFLRSLTEDQWCHFGDA